MTPAEAREVRAKLQRVADLGDVDLEALSLFDKDLAAYLDYLDKLAGAGYRGVLAALGHQPGDGWEMSPKAANDVVTYIYLAYEWGRFTAETVGRPPTSLRRECDAFAFKCAQIAAVEFGPAALARAKADAERHYPA